MLLSGTGTVSHCDTRHLLQGTKLNIHQRNAVAVITYKQTLLASLHPLFWCTYAQDLDLTQTAATLALKTTLGVQPTAPYTLEPSLSASFEAHGVSWLLPVVTF